MKQFGSDLRVAPAPNLEEMYGSYRQTVTYAPEYGIKPYGGGSGLLGMSETQVYNLFYNAMKTAIHNEQSGIEDRPIQLKVDLDGREIFNTVYDINQKNTHAGRSFVTEDYRGYHEPAPWITGRNLV